MTYRSVAAILKSEPLDMAGTTVKQPLPTVKVERIDPFLLLHHFGPYQVDPGRDPLDVAPHPHRGFEPVTFLYHGGIRHKDSRGNEGILTAGDVQWMTAGRGIIHSERASPAFKAEGGTMEGIQLWINLPKVHKMAQPAYQNIKADQIPKVKQDDGRVEIRVVAGEFAKRKGPVLTHTPIQALQLTLAENGFTTVPIPDGHNALIYILHGEVQVNENWSYEKETLLQFRRDGDRIGLKAIESTELLLLSGTPIGEPVAQWGPYVMNTQTEIMEAMRDYQMGKMGVYTEY